MNKYILVLFLFSAYLHSMHHAADGWHNDNTSHTPPKIYTPAEIQHLREKLNNLGDQFKNCQPAEWEPLILAIATAQSELCKATNCKP